LAAGIGKIKSGFKFLQVKPEFYVELMKNNLNTPKAYISYTIKYLFRAFTYKY